MVELIREHNDNIPSQTKLLMDISTSLKSVSVSLMMMTNELSTLNKILRQKLGTMP